MIVDMLLCVAIPCFFTYFQNQNIYDKIMVLYRFFTHSKYYQRHIEFTENGLYYHRTNAAKSIRNNLLYKAIEMYVAAHYENSIIKDGDINFIAMVEKSSYDDKTGYQTYGKTADQFKQYVLNHLPVKNSWLTLEPNLEIMRTKHIIKNKNGETANETPGIHLRSLNAKTCDSFFKKVTEWYTTRLLDLDDSTRYLYYPIVGKPTDTHTPLHFSKHKLHDYKQFDSIFFPHKKSFLMRIDTFQKKQGIYSVSGYPHKLGILLHGPPGTGKTSVIKALATHLSRHIVTVPLSIIKTKEHLQKIFYDLQYPVNEEEMLENMNYDEIIFVLEDIDCMSNIVHERNTNTKKDTNSLSVEELKLLLKKDESSGNDKSRICLSDLLEILDGILDAPGRIIIMTTNHKNTLDKALMRPGRMDIDLLMDFIQMNEAQQLLQHFNIEEKELDVEKLETYFKMNEKVTPAELVENHDLFLTRKGNLR